MPDNRGYKMCVLGGGVVLASLAFAKHGKNEGHYRSPAKIKDQVTGSYLYKVGGTGVKGKTLQPSNNLS